LKNRRGVISAMKEYLKLIGFFNSFSNTELDEFSSTAEVLSTNEMQIIINENEEGRGLYFIVNGDFEVLKKIEGKKYKRLQHLNEGDFFGEMSILNDEKHSATIISKDKGILIFISKEAFADLSRNNSSFSLKIMKELATILSTRLRRMNLKYGMTLARLESDY
jgi:CRP/FNR family cyclic AMP-dependent transcriptional regulator